MGLQAYFYDNYTQDNFYNDAPPIPPDTPMVFSIPVATVDQDFDLYPMSGLVDDFVVKYEGYITATDSGTVNLQCLADDGCIVIIDGVTVINEWWDKGTSGDVYQYTLVPNQSLPFTVWYYENGGGAVVQLRWQLENQDWAVVPEAVFSTMPKLITVIDVPSETQTVLETSTSTVESPTVVSIPETATPVEETVTVVDTQTSESSTQTTPTETPTVPIETPLPTPIPVVEPQPVPQPVPPAPAPPAPQPEPQPQPEPAPEPPPIAEEPPLEAAEPPPAPPEPAEQPPAEPPSAPPVEEDTSEIPSPPVPEVQPAPTPTPSPQPVVEPAPTSQPEIAYEPPTVTLDNGVILTQEEAVAVALLQNPGELLSELFTDPGAVFSALGSVGADMSPEVREKSEKVLVSAVIVGNIATQAAAVAGAATYRRKP